LVFTSFAMRDSVARDLTDAGINATFTREVIGFERTIREFERVSSGAMVSTMASITGWQVDADQVFFYLMVDVDPDSAEVAQAIGRARSNKTVNVIFVDCM